MTSRQAGGSWLASLLLAAVLGLLLAAPAASSGVTRQQAAEPAPAPVGTLCTTSLSPKHTAWPSRVHEIEEVGVVVDRVGVGAQVVCLQAVSPC
jgi:hypothetical protein